MLYAQVHLTLPAWIHDAVDPAAKYPDDASKMALALELCALNIEHRTGGPFGAAIFDGEGRLVSVGVNRVVDQHTSIAHAEMMAFMTAQHRLQRHRLNEGGGRYILATSAQPCCQCYGACVWAGIDELLIGARASDVEELTAFDEGPLPSDWQGALAQRGIAIRTDIARDEARALLARYSANDGAKY